MSENTHSFQETSGPTAPLFGKYTLVSQHPAPLSRGSHTVHHTRFYIQGRRESIHAALHLSGLCAWWWPPSFTTVMMMREWEASNQTGSGRNAQLSSGTYVKKKRIKTEFREKELTITLRNKQFLWIIPKHGAHRRIAYKSVIVWRKHFVFPPK